MRSLLPLSVLHLHSEGAVAITHKTVSDGSLKPHFFYQSPKATGSLEMALKCFYADSVKEQIFINLATELPTLHTFKDANLLRDAEAFAEVLEANSGISNKDCDVQFLESGSGDPYEGNGALLVNCSKRSDFLRAQALASELGFESFELFNNTLSIIGALQEWREINNSKETVAILEIGSNGGTITISTGDGLLKSRKAPISTQTIAECIQKKLELKFESAALLLFYNGIFDFSQHTQPIAQSFAESLSPILKEVSAKFGVSIDRLLVSSLPPSYRWVTEEVPKALGIRGFTSDDFSFLKGLPLLGDCAKNAGFIGMVYCAHSQPSEQPWMKPLQMQLLSVACKMSELSIDIPEPELPVEDLIETVDESRNVKKLEKKPLLKTSTPFSDKGGIPSQFLQPEEESFDIFGDSEPEEEYTEEASETPAMEVITFDKPIEEPPKAPATPPAPKVVASVEEEPTRKNKLAYIFTGIAALFIIGCCGLFFIQNAPKPAPIPIQNPSAEVVSVTKPGTAYEAFKAEAKTILEGKKVEVASNEATKDSPSIIPPVATSAPKDIEELEFAEVAAVETKAPVLPEAPPTGTLVIESTPPGATAYFNSFNKGITPLTIENVFFGIHTVELKLEGYVNKLLDIDVESTDPQHVFSKLDLPLGTLVVNTTPSGVDFDLISIDGLDTIVHSGTTPATIPDLMRGQYEVLFQRDDWEDYSESTKIHYNDTSIVDLVYPEGWVIVTSSPDNASVFEKGVFLGKTPLRIKGLKEGQKTYTLKLPGYEDIELSAEVVAQEETQMEAELLSWDREVAYTDLDVLPAQTKGGLFCIKRFVGNQPHRFLVEFVINAEGIPEDIEVIETTYLRAHERLIKDISAWEFEPGLRKDRAVKTRARIPVVLGDPTKLPPVVTLARVDDENE